MKKAFLLIPLILFVGSISTAGYKPDYYWVCSQVGVNSDLQPMYVITDVFKTENPGSIKKHQFEQIVKKNLKEFTPSYDASCNGFSSEQKADKYLKKVLGFAEKRKIMVLLINFVTQLAVR